MFSLGIISNNYIVVWYIGSQHHDTLTVATCLEKNEMKPPTERGSFIPQIKSPKLTWQSFFFHDRTYQPGFY
jgi:hypothetical protein